MNHFGQTTNKFQIMRNGMLTKAIQLAQLVAARPGLTRYEYLKMLKPELFAKGGLYYNVDKKESRGYYCVTWGNIQAKGWVKFTKEGYQIGKNFQQIADL